MPGPPASPEEFWNRGEGNSGSLRSFVAPPDDSHILLQEYSPMRRLLLENDVRFLRDHRHGSAELARRVRAQRRELFLEYLSDLRADVGALRREQRRNIASGLWRDRRQFERQGILFQYHFLRLYAAAGLHLLHLPAASRLAAASVKAIGLLASPAAPSLAGAG